MYLKYMHYMVKYLPSNNKKYFNHKVIINLYLLLESQKLLLLLMELGLLSIQDKITNSYMIKNIKYLQ